MYTYFNPLDIKDYMGEDEGVKGKTTL